MKLERNDNEMYSYCLGDQYFDKAMNGFMKQLFEKLKVRIILFVEHEMS